MKENLQKREENQILILCRKNSELISTRFSEEIKFHEFSFLDVAERMSGGEGEGGCRTKKAREKNEGGRRKGRERGFGRWDGGR